MKDKEKKIEDEIFNLKLEIFENKIEDRANEFFASNVNINQYFTRQDGFSTSRKLFIKNMTKGDYYYWVKRPYKLPIKQPLQVCDEIKPYFTDNVVEFEVVSFKFKRNLKNNILDIYYEEI